MNNKDTKNYGYLGKGDSSRRFYFRKGQVVSGYTIGILVLDIWFPIMPGNISCAESFNFPVRHKLPRNATVRRLFSFDPTLIDDLIVAGKELEMDGVRAICGACGYFGWYQQELAEALDVPVYLSSLIQIPWISIGLKLNQKIGIVCARSQSFSPELLKRCGVSEVDQCKCVFKGVEDEPEFINLTKNTGNFNNAGVEKDVVRAAVKLVEQNPDIGAILLECSDMPPYASEIQRAVNLPVYDFITMINWVHNSVAQKPYYGFI